MKNGQFGRMPILDLGQMSLHCLAELSRWTSILLSAASAGFWFAVSITKATKPDDSIGNEARYKDKKGREIYIHVATKKQSKLNAIAAILIGLMIIFQIAASLVDSLQSH
jgi:hypothetical protein